MTHALNSALKAFSPNWMGLGLEESYLRRVEGTLYAVLMKDSQILAVYRVTSGKLLATRLAEWPAAAVEDPLAKPKAITPGGKFSAG